MTRDKFIETIGSIGVWKVHGSDSTELCVPKQTDIGKRDHFLKTGGVSGDFKPIYEPFSLLYNGGGYYDIRYGSIDTSDMEVVSFLIDDMDFGLTRGRSRDKKFYEDLTDSNIKGKCLQRVICEYSYIRSIWFTVIKNEVPFL